VKDCLKCIMKHDDSFVLLEPTIYFVEGNLYLTISKSSEEDPAEDLKPWEKRRDDSPF